MSPRPPADPGFRQRLHDSFARQGVMQTLGARLEVAEPGHVVIVMAHQPALTQQHGFLHAGIVATALDSACGYAAFTLMPADAAVLTIEFKVNLLAPALLVRALAPGIIARGGGAIVNVSSGLAFFPKERAGLYAAAKAGVHSFTQSLRYQMEGQGVAVIEVILPLVDTPMTAGRGKGKISAEAAATAILQGLARGKPVICVGAARALPLIQALAPWLGRRMLRGS